MTLKQHLMLCGDVVFDRARRKDMKDALITITGLNYRYGSELAFEDGDTLEI